MQSQSLTNLKNLTLVGFHFFFINLITLDNVDSVVSVAGGFVMSGIKEDAIFETVEKMWSFNVQSAVLASHVAANVLKEGGLLVLTGATAALNPTPAMIGYGISKVSTHHLVASLAKEGSGMPKGYRPLLS